MTMPHLMNCPHSCDSWCLDCVKEQWDQLAAVTKERDELRAILMRAWEAIDDTWFENCEHDDAFRDLQDAIAPFLQPGDDA